MKLSEINIDKSSEQPIYQQIVEQIISLIQQGKLSSGEKLPTAQDFFSAYGIARGTIKHAYSLLEKRGVITVLRGKGTFVSKNEELPKNGDVIDIYLKQLLDLNLSLEKIEELVAKKLKEKEDQENILRMGIIETCPEMLDCFSDSLSQFRNLHIDKLLVNDLASVTGLPLEDYDLLVLASSNAQILSGMELSHDVKAELIPIAAAFSTQTLKSLAKIKLGESVGIFCQTKRYAGIIKWELASLNALLMPSQTLFFTASPDDIMRFCRDKCYILTAKSYKSLCTPEQLSVLAKFESNGGQIFPIEYTIDKGSSLYLEDIIRNYRLTHYKNLSR